MQTVDFGNFFSNKAKQAAGKAANGLKAAAPHADHALEWVQRQRDWVKPKLPSTDAVEQWVRANATKYGWSEQPASTSLEHLENILTQTIAAIQQTSDKRARVLVRTVIGKFGGAMAVGGISGLVVAFGTASTGTAIASLSGAAATTAQLYWIGSLFGLGVAGGGLVLSATGVGAAVAAAIWGHRKLLGNPRVEDSLQEHEKAIVLACITLINATKQQRKSGQEASAGDMRLVAQEVLFPLANQINQHWDDASLNENGKSECRPFTPTLAYLQRRKLDWCRTELGRIATSAMAKAGDH